LINRIQILSGDVVQGYTVAHFTYARTDDSG